MTRVAVKYSRTWTVWVFFLRFCLMCSRSCPGESEGEGDSRIHAGFQPGAGGRRTSPGDPTLWSAQRPLLPGQMPRFAQCHSRPKLDPRVWSPRERHRPPRPCPAHWRQFRDVSSNCAAVDRGWPRQLVAWGRRTRGSSIACWLSWSSCLAGTTNKLAVPPRRLAAHLPSQVHS